MTINTGGPAYPVSGWESKNGDEIAPSNGMTYRQWLKGQALTGIIAAFSGHEVDIPEVGYAARKAAAYADAIIAHEEAEAKKLEGEPT
jgi:hypothetical protein